MQCKNCGEIMEEHIEGKMELTNEEKYQLRILIDSELRYFIIPKAKSPEKLLTE